MRRRRQVYTRSPGRRYYDRPFKNVEAGSWIPLVAWVGFVITLVLALR